MRKGVFKALFMIGMTIFVIGCQGVSSVTTYTTAKNPLIGTWESNGYVRKKIDLDKDSKYAEIYAKVTFRSNGTYGMYEKVKNSEDTNKLPNGEITYDAKYWVDHNNFYLFQDEPNSFDECIKGNVLYLGSDPLYKQ